MLWHKCLVGLSSLRFWNFHTFLIYLSISLFAFNFFQLFSELPILEYVNPAIYLANICKNNPSIRMRCIMSHYVRASISYYEYQVKLYVFKSKMLSIAHMALCIKKNCQLFLTYFLRAPRMLKSTKLGAPWAGDLSTVMASAVSARR